MNEIAHTWTSTGTTSAFNTPVYLDFPCLETALYCESSTIATTNSFQLQTGLSSAGPWNVVGSTAITADGNGAALDVLRITGPLAGWVRPVLKTASTGAYTLKLMGVS